MAGFATRPFEEQLTLILETVGRGDDPRMLLGEAGRLPDAEPLARLLEALARDARLGPEVERTLDEVLAELPDAGLAYLLSRESMHRDVRALLVNVVARALHAWPLTRIHALVLLSRWLRRVAPDVHARLVSTAEAQVAEDGADGRWLLFVGGERLAALAADPTWSPLVRSTVKRALDALARAPKSISQANAEALLARRVYADAGHFFFELLQNADDAGAARWRARIEEDRVVVAHDGTPFSFQDVVGVLSIGQTTKREEQIGFFGVGFKSVYEVSQRPRIHSGPFDFEVAHVSIPRALAERPPEADPEETLLVLPLAPDVEGPALFEHARAIPPETLLTLPHVTRMDARGPSGERWSWEKHLEENTVTLQGGDPQETRRYLQVASRVRFEGEREEGRAAESPVQVAVALDGAGRPQPLQGPAVFAFLPTAEHTGLRALVHARFDVTLDRERLERDSPWNDALLAEGGRALADAADALARTGHGVLPILPSPDEIAPSVLPLARALWDALGDRPCLPSADGTWIAPRHARMLEPALARSLAGQDLGAGARALAPLDAREQRVARALGAADFTETDLVDFARRALRRGQTPPTWLDEEVASALGRAPVSDDDLRALPLLRDGGGQLVTAADAQEAPAAWAVLYAGLRPVVSDTEVARWPATLRRRIRPTPFDPARARTDLADSALRERFLARERALLDALALLDDATLATLHELPLLRTRGDGRRSVADGLRRLGPELAQLGDVLAPHVPLVAADLEAAHAALMARWIPRFGLSELADTLAAMPPLDDPVAQRIADALDDGAQRIGRPLAWRLASVPLFRDHHGTRRPLVGAGCAVRTRDAHLREALPDWPWIEAPERPFVQAVDPPWIEAPAVAGALMGDPALPPVPLHAVESILRWLADHAGQLSGEAVDALARAPVWLDTEGHLRPLVALRPGDGSDAVHAYFDAAATRAVAHPATLRLTRALRITGRFPASDLEAAVDDLIHNHPPPSVERTLVAGVLAEAVTRLPESELAPLRHQPLFHDEDGVARPLAGWDAPAPHACHRAGPFRAFLRGGPLPLLAPGDETLFAPLLDLVGPAPATTADLIRHARADAAWLRDPAAFRALLARHGSDLDDGSRALLAELPVFRSMAGTCHAAGTLAPGHALRETLGAARLENVVDALFHPDDEALAHDLALPVRPAPEVLETRILPGLHHGAPLHVQPDPWQSRDALAALLEASHRLGVDLNAHPLCVDAGARVVRGPLATASDGVRRLAPALGLHEGLADPAWVALLPPPVADAVCSPMPTRRVVEALRAHCPDEAPMRDHPILTDRAPLYDFLRDARSDLEADPQARGALASAAVLPSQRGTLRAPRTLVLDRTLPDLGLAWGLASEVPEDIARWLAATYELDRDQRRTILDHALDGLDEAARAEDTERAAELVRFVAGALGALQVDGEVLERRARRSKVRDRLRVPLMGGGWDKPRRAWVAPTATAERVDRFCLDAPPRIALPHIDDATAALLVACGAQRDLPEDTVARCLRGEGLRSGRAARVALALHVVDRALAVPALKERWRLAQRAWVPDTVGTPRRPGELLWPDDLAVSLLGEDGAPFPDYEIASRLDDEEAWSLGFRRASDLPLDEMATTLGDVPASPALLQWLEDGLAAGRWTRDDVRRTLGDTLRLRDDTGCPRPIHALAREGTGSLFGTFRGDFSEAHRFPTLAGALGIPSQPHAHMVVAFLEEMGASLDDLSDPERAELTRHLPACLEWLGEQVERGQTIHLPRTAAVAALRGDQVVLTRLEDPALCMLEPPERAEQLSPASLRGMLDPLPTGRDPGVVTLLQNAGVRTLEEPASRSPSHRHGGKHPAREPMPGGEAGGMFQRLRRWAAGDGSRPGRPAPPARRRPSEATPGPANRRREAPDGTRDDGRFFRTQSHVGAQLETSQGWLESRREQPRFGFAFTPARLPPPWLYAPKLVATRFDTRGQQWRPAPLDRPTPQGDVGMVVLRGRLPEGDALLPIPCYARVTELRLDGADGELTHDAAGGTVLHLDGPADVRLRVSLGHAPDPSRGVVDGPSDALDSFVPDDELPEEALAFLDDLDMEAPPADRAVAIRDFVRDRYRYDPTYLEDPGVARWLARITQGKANAHVAALHAGRDERHLGAGVCYELNTLACELLRRARIPAGIATGWVYEGGSLSEPDHLWAVALLRAPDGGPLWLPVDASVTRTGRPLRIPRRPPARFRAPRDPKAKAPKTPRGHDHERGGGRGSAGHGRQRRPPKPKKRRPPRAELLRVLHHLEKTAGRSLTADERAEAERALSNPRAAQRLLERLTKSS